MAYQPETANYDVGVYQLEIDDPVQGGVGGVSNAPLLSLANRTAWLYLELTGVLSGTIVPTGVAPLNSPQFTGSPTTPTPALGDNSLAIANTSWVQSTVSGVLSLSVAGGANVTLTAVQAGNGILNFTGALTASIAVIVPAAGKWAVQNNTTGAYTLTVKTASGNGIAVAQGKSANLFCDGTNVYLSQTDYSGLALTGIPTGPTAAVNTNTTQLATTAFVLGQASTTAPKANGTVAVGTGTTFARADHVHPTDTTLAPLASPALTGTPTAPTATAGTNTTQLATTAFVTTAANAASGASLPLAGGAMTGNVKTLTQSETVVTPTQASGTLTLNLALGNVFVVTLTANVTTVSITNPPATGTDFAFTLIVTTGSYSITWPSSVAWPAATAPTLSTTTDRFVFETNNGGTTYRACVAGQNF